MRCRKCGAEMPDGLLYCGKCRGNLKRQSSGSSFLFTKKMLPVWLGVLAAVALVVTGIFVIPGLLNETPNNPDPGNQDAAQIIERMKDLEDDFGFENALSELTEKSTTTIDGDTYYRLQQNYQGIPVYGRTVVYVTDENGEAITITGNVLDVGENINANPTITIEELTAEITAYAVDMLGVSPDDCALNILSHELVWYVDSSDHTVLAYRVWAYIGGDPYDVVVDANTGDVYALSYQMMTESVSVSMSVDGYEHEINLWQEDDGSYITYDAENNIRVLSANGETLVKVLVFELATGEKYRYNCYTESWYNERGTTCTMPTDPYVSLAIEFTTEENLVGVTQPTFADLEILDQDACRMLFFTTIANDYFSQVLSRDGWEDGNTTTLQVVFDCANGSYHYSPEYGVSMLSIESGSSLNTVAHELTHAIESTESGMTYSGESGAIMEALSDIFAEIVEYDFLGACDWLYDSGLRNLIDPSLSTESNMAHPSMYKGKNWYSGSQDNGGVHINSTVISHAAYLMSVDSGGLLTMDELAKLWYRAMLMMPSDCNFAECRTLVELAGESMHLSDKKMQSIRAAFDNAGIPDERAVDYTINKNTKLSVYGIDSELYDNYIVKVEGRQWYLENYKSLDAEKIGFPVNIDYLYHTLTKEYSNEIDPSSAQPMDLNLPEGTYSITLCDQTDNSKTYTFRVSVAASGGKDKLDIYTDFGVLQTQKRLSCIKEYRDGQLYRSQYLHYDEQTGLLERNKIVQELEDDNYLYGETFNYTYEYDELNRLVKWSSLPGLYIMPTLEFIYDDNGRLSAWKHNKRDPLLGNLEGKCFYDDSGRLIQTVGKWDVHTETTEYKYNEFGLLTEAIQDSTVFDGDSVLQYQYDSQNRVSLVTTTDQYGTNTEKYIYDYYPIVLITGAYGEYEYTYACYDLGYLSNMNPHLAHRYFTLICVSDHSNPDRFSADEDGYLKNIEGTEYGAGRHVVKYEYIWEEIGSPHKETTTPPEDEAKMYTQYLLNGGYEELLTMDADPESLEISSCLADIDEDGVKELFITVYNMDNIYISTHSALLDIVNGNVSIMVRADDWGGSMGGDKLRFRKDSKTHKHVLEFCGYMRDGQFKGDNHSNIYSISFDSYNVEYSFESIWTYIGEGALDEYVEQARKIADKYYETYSYYDDEDYFFTYKIDGQYVSEEGYEAAMARFVDPDEAYTLKPVTYNNPIP